MEEDRLPKTVAGYNPIEKRYVGLEKEGFGSRIAYPVTYVDNDNYIFIPVIQFDIKFVKTWRPCHKVKQTGAKVL